MLNQDYHRVLLDLQDRHAKIGRAIEALRDLAHLFTDGAATPPVQTSGVAIMKKLAAPAKRGRRPNGSPPSCEKHPENTKFYANGQCAGCQKEYAQQRYRETHPNPRPRGGRKKKANGAPTNGNGNGASAVVSSGPIAEAFQELIQEEERSPILDITTEPEFVYSRVVKCPKCFIDGVRLRRLKDADPAKDYWLHIRDKEVPCMIKIVHYNIKADPKYQPEAKGTLNELSR